MLLRRGRAVRTAALEAAASATGSDSCTVPPCPEGWDPKCWADFLRQQSGDAAAAEADGFADGAFVDDDAMAALFAGGSDDDTDDDSAAADQENNRAAAGCETSVSPAVSAAASLLPSAVPPELYTAFAIARARMVGEPPAVGSNVLEAVRSQLRQLQAAASVTRSSDRTVIDGATACAQPGN
eukprot:SAG31_NODE_18823_length_621_cov_1.289272_1_plen_182_part_01